MITDTAGARASLRSFDISVVNVNDGPTISGMPETSVDQGSPYTFTPVGADADSEHLRYSIENQPPWADFSTITRALTGTPTDQQHVGVYENIVITITDIPRPGLSASLPPFSIEVRDINDRPTLVLDRPRTVPWGQILTITATGADMDGGPLTYRILNAPSWTTFSTTTNKDGMPIGVLTGTPELSDVGEYEDIVIFASDGLLQIGRRFALTNTPPTGLPTITGTTTQGQTLTTDTSGISDADGPASLSFTYQWNRRSGTTDTAISGATSANYILTGDDVGEMITVAVRYTDAGNTNEGPLTSAPFGPVDTNEMRTVLLADGRSITVATHNTADTTDPQMITELNTGEVDSSVALDPEGLDNVKLLPENEANNNVTGILLAAGSAVDITTNAGACTDDNPCRLTLSYTTDDLEELGGITSDQLAIFHYTSINNNNVWEELAEADVTAQTITASTSSFSPFALGTLVFNTGPTADAGPDQTVEEGASVTLDGSGSSDPDDDTLTYTWEQTDGTPMVTLNNASAESPTFTAPANLSANAVLVFSLTVNDGTSDSTPDPVRISVTTDAPARQQALKTGLAALGRGLAASATDAIGQRLKPAATGPETSSFSGLSLANCIANMTSLTPTDTASADGADRSAWFDPRDMGGDIGSAEPDNDSRNNSRNPLGACRLPDSGQLARSAFVIPLNRLSGKGNAGAGGGYWSLWGRGDLSRFEGRPPQTGLDLDGNLTVGYLGLDYRLSSGGLVGVALSRSEGEIDIGTADGAFDKGTFDKGTFDKGTLDKGTLDARLNSVYPYGYWSPRAGMGLWGLLGVGSGDATLSHRETDFATDLDMRMEASHSWQLQPDERLGTSLELGARVDGGDADEGAGAELGVGLEYSNTRLGLRAQWRAQGLLAHSASGFEEWGTSLNVELDPGVSGRGLALTLAPTWGQAASGGAQALWQSDRPLRASGLAPASAMRMDLDLSYGLNRDRRQLSPFASLGLADGVMQRLRLGLRLGLGLADELEMELFGGRNASGNRSPEHLLGLTGSKG